MDSILYVARSPLSSPPTSMYLPVGLIPNARGVPRVFCWPREVSSPVSEFTE